jgi:hypothetical protein
MPSIVRADALSKAAQQLIRVEVEPLLQPLAPQEGLRVRRFGEPHLKHDILKKELDRFRSQPTPRHAQLHAADTAARECERQLKTIESVRPQSDVRQHDISLPDANTQLLAAKFGSVDIRVQQLFDQRQQERFQ